MRVTAWMGAVALGGAIAGGGCGQQGATVGVDDDAGTGSDDGDSPGDDDDDAAETGDDGTSADYTVGLAVLPRLTGVQYRNTVLDLLGGPLPATALEPDTNPHLFYSVGATTTTLSEVGTQLYEESAQALTHAVFDDPGRREQLLGCTPAAVDDDCVYDFITQFGARAFRRPLTDDERQLWTSLVAEVDAPDAVEALRLVTAGMLQAPSFVYRVELGEPDPAHPGGLRYTAYEMATRLSYLLWDTMPDDTLFEAAASGALTSTEEIAAQTERMLASPRARASIQAFFAQVYDLSRLDGITRDETLYPDFNPLMPAQMRAEVSLLVDDVVLRRDADFRSIFNTRQTFVTNHLAALYDVDAPGATPITFVPVQLPEDGPRRGLLSTAALLTMNAHETETSPTLRGKFVRDRVLCDEVAAPPDDVELDVSPDPENPQTLRERLEEHRENPVCAACHDHIDPPGFLFEHFDSVGAYRQVDGLGLPLDSSGEIDGTALADASELADYLAADARVGTCVVQHLYRHAQGRLLAPDEAPALAELADGFADDDYRYQSLLRRFVTHDSFRTLTGEENGQ